MTIYKKQSHGKSHLYGRTEIGEQYIGPEDDPSKWNRAIVSKILERENRKIMDSLSLYIEDIQFLTRHMPEAERREYFAKRHAEILAKSRYLKRKHR